MTTLYTFKHTDSCGRRLRAHGQSSGRAVECTPRLLRLMDAIRRKGPLPTGLCFPLWRGEGDGGYRYFQRRIGAFFHEREGGGPYLVRPGELNPAWGTKAEPAWYDLSPRGHALARMSRAYIFPPKRDPMRHRAMGASIAASFEVLAPGLGLRFVDKEEFASAPSFPAHVRSRENPLVIPVGGGVLEPDDLFGLEYRLPDGRRGMRYFAREDDRGTESVSRSDRLQTSLRSKLERYVALFETSPRLFTTRWGITNLRVLFTTTNPGRIDTLLRFLDGKPHADRFLFKALPTFGVHWRAPREPIAELMQPWRSVGGEYDIIETQVL